MADEPIIKLAAHQALYRAQADAGHETPDRLCPGSLAALDAALAVETWRWEPSPTAFASWAEYAAAHRAWLNRQSRDQAAE